MEYRELVNFIVVSLFIIYTLVILILYAAQIIELNRDNIIKTLVPFALLCICDVILLCIVNQFCTDYEETRSVNGKSSGQSLLDSEELTQTGSNATQIKESVSDQSPKAEQLHSKQQSSSQDGGEKLTQMDGSEEKTEKSVSDQSPKAEQPHNKRKSLPQDGVKKLMQVGSSTVKTEKSVLGESPRAEQLHGKQQSSSQDGGEKLTQMDGSEEKTEKSVSDQSPKAEQPHNKRKSLPQDGVKKLMQVGSSTVKTEKSVLVESHKAEQLHSKQRSSSQDGGEKLTQMDSSEAKTGKSVSEQSPKAKQSSSNQQSSQSYQSLKQAGYLKYSMLPNGKVDYVSHLKRLRERLSYVKTMEDVTLSSLRSRIEIQRAKKKCDGLISSMADYANQIQTKMVVLSRSDESRLAQFKSLQVQHEKYDMCWREYVMLMEELFKNYGKYVKFYGTDLKIREEERVLLEKIRVANGNFAEQLGILNDMLSKSDMQDLVDVQGVDVKKSYKSYNVLSKDFLSIRGKCVAVLRSRVSVYEQLLAYIKEKVFIGCAIEECNEMIMRQGETSKKETASSSTSVRTNVARASLQISRD